MKDNLYVPNASTITITQMKQRKDLLRTESYNLAWNELLEHLVLYADYYDTDFTTNKQSRRVKLPILPDPQIQANRLPSLCHFFNIRYSLHITELNNKILEDLTYGIFSSFHLKLCTFNCIIYLVLELKLL
ncbi:MAG: hypothetical protein EOP34_02720 [Rickettsiales bacterium]|nr:MAG: hypothetical protein EOP34_02720 [Rickettsiales bacterium]